MTHAVMDVRQVPGRAFEDILDGYFPLAESIRQMMERQGFTAVWLTLLHAPVMNIKGLGPLDPVPLSLRKIYAGMIHNMSLEARRTQEGLSLDGAGDWFWLNPDDEAATFPETTRLGEPAFVRGIGLTEDAEAPVDTGVAVLRLPPSVSLSDAVCAATAQLGWASSRAWGLGRRSAGIERLGSVDAGRAVFGDSFEACSHESQRPSPPAFESTYALVDTSPTRADEEQLALALRL